MTTALVTGLNGQDGRLAAEHLLMRGYDVVGVGRQSTSILMGHDRLRYVPLDLQDTAALSALIAQVQPDLALHLAAVHGAAGFQYETQFAAVLAVNVTALHALLEHARLRPDMTIVYASSAKVFGSPPPALITEASPAVSNCLYSISKNAAHDTLALYRREHGVSATTLYLFNHESIYRQPQYFVPQIVRALAAARVGSRNRHRLRSLDFLCNWGCAREYMEIAIELGEQRLADDYIIARDKTWHGREFCQTLFEKHGLDYRDHLEAAFEDSAPTPVWRPATEKLRHAVGRSPRRDILDVCDEMLAALERPQDQAVGKNC